MELLPKGTLVNLPDGKVRVPGEYEVYSADTDESTAFTLLVRNRGGHPLDPGSLQFSEPISDRTILVQYVAT